jgi:DMSO/TMAO reductase YedYZ molybdopterin-dependent catalytic subunit
MTEIKTKRATVLLFLLTIMLVAAPASAYTTELTVTKLANDGETVLDQQTVDIAWMEENLPVYGDGVTHYYFQGPSFDPDNLWDLTETINVDSRDYGPVNGSDVKDLCELVGGMEAGEWVKIQASDLFSKNFDYDDVYLPEPELGRMVIAWYNPDYGGYPPAYDTGMRLIFFANTTNPDGKYVFGNWDMHNTLNESRWHYNYDSNTQILYPSSSGLSVQKVAEIIIYSDDPAPVNVIYEGTATLAEGSFTWVDSEGVSHDVPNLTPHGALEAAFLSDGFTYGGGWSGSKSTALIDWIDDSVTNYSYDDSNTPKLTWNYQLNGVYQNYFSSSTGMSNNAVSEGDYIEFYYGPDQQTTENATAVVRINVEVEQPPAPVDVLFGGDLTLVPGTFDFVAYNSGDSYQIDSLTPHGALDAAAKIAGFEYNATDKKWGSMATMLLDDVGDYRYDSSVTPKLVWAYAVNGVVKNDFSSTEGISVYRINDGDMVEFYYGKSGDTCENATAIVQILVHVNEPDILFDGDVTLVPGTFNFTAYNSNLDYQINTTTPHGALDTAAKIAGFEYNATDKKWGSMATMLLNDVADYRYNSSVTPNLVWGYAVNGVVKNDFSSTEGISTYELQNNDRVEFFYGLKGDLLQNATAVVRIRTHISSTDNWTLLLKGAQTVEIDRQYFEEGVACLHSANYTDLSGIWEGMPLWDLVGYVDDAYSHGPGAFNDSLANEGYQVKIIASDGYNLTFNSRDIARNDSYIIANTLNGEPLLEQHWPLKLVGPAIIPKESVARINAIELIGVEPIEPPVTVHVIKYAHDGTTIINETTVSVDWMKANLDVIGDGSKEYKFQGTTNDPTDLWSPGDETKGGFKIVNAVMGTRVRDICELVGGMGSGTEITFVGIDGYETKLSYSSIYTNPAVQARQGDTILAWYADGNEVPDYSDGIRLFFTPEDTIYSQWDMHETLPENYWHYYYDSATATMYPSCAGLSAKWVTTIKIYSEPEEDWTLELDGTTIGGINYTVSKNYFEQALACQFGAEHKASYTDSKSRVWEGMPLWFLAGFVDDADKHSDTAFNDTLALAGYDVIVKAGEDYSSIIQSEDTIRNGNFIVANTLNGTLIPETDSSWPLRLVGDNVTSSETVKGITDIILNFRPSITGIDAPDTARLSKEVTVTAYFSDPYDTHTAVFDWGDNEKSDGIVDEINSAVSGSHIYSVPGTYLVHITITDSLEAGDTKSATIKIISSSSFERTEALQDYIIEEGLPKGTETALLSKLSAAMKFMDEDSGMMKALALTSDGKDSYRPKTAVNILEAFIHYVEAQDGKKIPHDIAIYLISEAEGIVATLMEDTISIDSANTEPENANPPDISIGKKVETRPVTAVKKPNANSSDNHPSEPQVNSDESSDDESMEKSGEPGSKGRRLGQMKDKQNKKKGK